jgi:hypothetical protein
MGWIELGWKMVHQLFFIFQRFLKVTVTQSDTKSSYKKITKSSEDGVHTLSQFSLEFNPFLPIDRHIPGFLQNSFEKCQVTACRFSKEFCENSINVSTNRKRGISLCCLQNSFVNF